MCSWTACLCCSARRAGRWTRVRCRSRADSRLQACCCCSLWPPELLLLQLPRPAAAAPKPHLQRRHIHLYSALYNTERFNAALHKRFPLHGISRLSVFQWCMVRVFFTVYGAMTLLKEYWTSGSKHGVMYVSWCMCKITWSSRIKQHIHQNCLTLLNEMSIQ